MSVFIVSPEHINVLLDAALRYTDNIGMTVYTSNGQALTIDRTNRDKVGQMLLDTNAASAGARHQEDTELYIYSYRTPARSDLKSAGKVHGREVTLADGNQASAGDLVVTRKNARAFCEALRRAVIPALPGYTDAPWEITTTSTPAHTAY